MKQPIRILSDVHWGHHASLVKDPRLLEPLSEGAAQLIFNGDSVESIYEGPRESKGSPLPSFEEFAGVIADWGLPTRYINGNHDPEISETNYLLSANESLLITHGDGIFDSIAPWSSKKDLLSQAFSEKREEFDTSTLDGYLRSVKAASVRAHQMADGYDPTSWGRLRILIHEAWPPTLPFRVIRSWLQTPQRAAELPARFGIDARAVVIGHTHWSGVWNVENTWVVNTGSFFPWPGALAVDAYEDRLVCRRIAKCKSHFRLGRIVKEIPLACGIGCLFETQATASAHAKAPIS